MESTMQEVKDMEVVKDIVCKLIQTYMKTDIVQLIDAIENNKDKLIIDIKIKLCLDKNNEDVHNMILQTLDEIRS